MTDQCSELWLPVRGYEGLYEVSDQGRVRSVDRVVPGKRGDRVCEIRRAGKMLSLRKGTRKHYMVSLCRDGIEKQISVHVLVLTAFVGPRPDGMVGCHGPDGQLDNRIMNLRWDTQSANVYDAVDRDGTHANSAKTRCKRKHRLAGPNLVRFVARYVTRTGRGDGRRCLACSRAHAAVRGAFERHGVVLDMQTVSDEYYERIMSAAA